MSGELKVPVNGNTQGTHYNAGYVKIAPFARAGASVCRRTKTSPGCLRSSLRQTYANIRAIKDATILNNEFIVLTTREPIDNLAMNKPLLFQRRYSAFSDGIPVFVINKTSPFSFVIAYDVSAMKIFRFYKQFIFYANSAAHWLSLNHCLLQFTLPTNISGDTKISLLSMGLSNNASSRSEFTLSLRKRLRYPAPILYAATTTKKINGVSSMSSAAIIDSENINITGRQFISACIFYIGIRWEHRL